MTRTQHLQEAFKFALAMGLSYMVALWMDWEHPLWAGFSVLTCSLATADASLERGLLRLGGTIGGCVLGLLLVALFNDSPLAMYLAVLCVIVACSTFAYSTHFWFAWLVTAFVTVLVVVSSYPHWDLSLSIAIERTAETALGIIVYMLVSALLWPRYSGPLVQDTAAKISHQLEDLFRIAQRELSGENASEEFESRRNSLIESVSNLDELMPGALLDSPALRARRSAWRQWRADLGSFSNALLLWRDSFRHVGKNPTLCADASEAQRNVKELLTAACDCWSRVDDIAGPPPATPTPAPDERPIEVPGRSLLERAEQIGFEQQLRTMASAGERILANTRILAGLESPPPRAGKPRRQHPRSPRSVLDSDMLVRVLRPALAWSIGFLIWMLVEGIPGGPAMLTFTVAVGIAMGILYVPGPVTFIKPFVLGTVAAAPVCFFVLPWIETPYALFAVIVLYSLPLGYIGSRGNFFGKVFGTLPLLLGAHITNQQSFNFTSFADALLVIGVAFVVLALTAAFLPQIRPQDALRRNVRDLLLGCARVVRIPPGDAGSHSGPQQRAIRSLRTVLGLSIRLNAPVRVLLQNSSEESETRKRLIRVSNAAQVLAVRIDELERARHRAMAVAAWPLRTLEPIGGVFRNQLVTTLVEMATFKTDPARPSPTDELADAKRTMERLVAKIGEVEPGRQWNRDQLLSVFLLTESANTLVPAVRALQEALLDMGPNLRKLDELHRHAH